MTTLMLLPHGGHAGVIGRVRYALMVSSNVRNSARNLVRVLERSVLALLCEGVIVILVQVRVRLLLRVLVRCVEAIRVRSYVNERALYRPERLRVRNRVDVRVEAAITLVPRYVVRANNEYRIVLLKECHAVINAEVPSVRRQVVFSGVAPSVLEANGEEITVFLSRNGVRARLRGVQEDSVCIQSWIVLVVVTNAVLMVIILVLVTG